jgi:hypothetical protein
MRLAEATAYTRLRDDGLRQQKIPKQVRLALDLAQDIFAEAEEREQPFLYHTPESWVRKWLPSKRFHLVRLPLNAAAMPCEPKGDNLVLKKIHAQEEKPIVVDYNRNQIGKSMHGFVPQIIVIDGKHRFKAAALRGQSHIMAWVGEIAAEQIHALGGGGPAPERTTGAPGAKLNANSRQEVGHEAKNLAGKGLKLKKLDVEDVNAGGPGSGRHKENHDAITNSGWEVTRKNSAGKQYQHMDRPGMYINRDNGAWGYRIPGKVGQSGDSGRDLKSLNDHLEKTSNAGSKGIY